MGIHDAFLLAFWSILVPDAELAVYAPFAAALTSDSRAFHTAPPLPTAAADFLYLRIEQLFLEIDLRQIHAWILRGRNINTQAATPDKFIQKVFQIIENIRLFFVFHHSD
jgi:hypothetical protein